MKNLRAHHHLVIASLLVFGVASVWSWGVVVFAASADTNVEVYIGPPDVCPNIPGYQTSVPAGMEKDGNGNCYTPTPPPTDFCGNIDGAQESLPTGYYIENGSCYPQPVPPATPQDVCNNIAGLQESVPADRVSNTGGNCVSPRRDLCQNIDGPQYVIPSGMKLSDDEQCFTPVITVDSTPPATTDDSYVSPFDIPYSTGAVEQETLRNMPMWLAYVVQPLIDLIPYTLKQALRELPPDVAKTFPYYVFTVLTAGSLVVVVESLSALGAVGRLTAATRKKQTIVDEKYQFFTLLVSYLSAPITDGLERNSHLATYVRNIQAELSEGNILSSVDKPAESAVDHSKIVASALLWLPVILTFCILLICNFLFGVVGGIKLELSDMITQSLGFTLLGLFFYRALRSRNTADHELKQQQELATYEQRRDAAMNTYIHSMTLRLSQLVNEAASTLTTSNYQKISNMIDKLQLLSEIDISPKNNPRSFDLTSLVVETLEAHDAEFRAKRMSYTVNLPKSRIFQHRDLLKFVLSSLIDTALSLGKEGSELQVSATSDEETLHISFLDEKVAVGSLVISELQHSFHSEIRKTAQVDPAGLSLILDKIIMDYMNGDINSAPKRKSAELSLTIPN